ncbi:MAG: rhodanese-like domain-containing protein [Desulfovibrionaceae bacterium]|nr:rhodanese-like domain-containing protein [Desulfovibrionaceae bacterium]
MHAPPSSRLSPAGLAFLLTFWIALAVFAAIPARAGDVLSPAELPAWLAATPDALIVDVRTPEEYARGHLEGSVNIPIDSFEDRLDEIPVDRPVLIHCRMGVRAERAYGIVKEKKPEAVRVHMVRGPLEEFLR